MGTAEVDDVLLGNTGIAVAGNEGRVKERASRGSKRELREKGIMERLAASLRWCGNRNPDQTNEARFALFGVYVPTLAITNHLAPNTCTSSQACLIWVHALVKGVGLVC